MLSVVQSYQAAGQRHMSADVIDAVATELTLRQSARNHQENVAEQNRLHQMASDQAVATHRDIMQKLEVLKTSVEDLGRPHWTLTPTFWISFGILVVSVVILAVAYMTWKYPADQQLPPTGKPAPSSSNSGATPPIPITRGVRVVTNGLRVASQHITFGAKSFGLAVTIQHRRRPL